MMHNHDKGLESLEHYSHCILKNRALMLATTHGNRRCILHLDPVPGLLKQQQAWSETGPLESCVETQPLVQE